MANDILKNIHVAAESFPKNQRAVADYILNNWETVLHESSTAVAKKLGVSQSTIMRTVRGFGYAGFSDFQKDLVGMFHERMSTIRRIEGISKSQKGKGLDETISSVFELQKKNIAITRYNIDPETVRKCTEAIWSADNVMTIGMRTASALSHYLGIHLAMIRRNVQIMSNEFSLLENIQQLGERDVVIAFCFARYPKTTLNAVDLARKKKCRIIGITDVASSPLTPLADSIFFTPVASMHFSTSYIAAFLLIDVLLNAIGLANKEHVSQTLTVLEEGLESLKTYVYSSNE